MTVKEARKLIAVFMVTYPNYKPIDAELAAVTWADIMSEYTYEQVSMGLTAYMRTNTSGFAPAPGQLVEQIQKITKPQELNEMEAWALVYRALGNSTYHSVEEFARLPPLVQKAVGLPDNLREWAMTENFNADVAGSNFMRTYRQVVEYENAVQKYPEGIKERIQMASQDSTMAQIELERQRTIKYLPQKEKPCILAQDGQKSERDIPNSVKVHIAKVKQDLNKN